MIKKELLNNVKRTGIKSAAAVMVAASLAGTVSIPAFAKEAPESQAVVQEDKKLEESDKDNKVETEETEKVDEKEDQQKAAAKNVTIKETLNDKLANVAMAAYEKSSDVAESVLHTTGSWFGGLVEDSLKSVNPYVAKVFSDLVEGMFDIKLGEKEDKTTEKLNNLQERVNILMNNFDNFKGWSELINKNGELNKDMDILKAATRVYFVNNTNFNNLAEAYVKEQAKEIELKKLLDEHKEKVSQLDNDKEAEENSIETLKAERRIKKYDLSAAREESKIQECKDALIEMDKVIDAHKKSLKSIENELKYENKFIDECEDDIKEIKEDHEKTTQKLAQCYEIASTSDINSFVTTLDLIEKEIMGETNNDSMNHTTGVDAFKASYSYAVGQNDYYRDAKESVEGYQDSLYTSYTAANAVLLQALDNKSIYDEGADANTINALKEHVKKNQEEVTAAYKKARDLQNSEVNYIHDASKKNSKVYKDIKSKLYNYTDNTEVLESAGGEAEKAEELLSIIERHLDGEVTLREHLESFGIEVPKDAKYLIADGVHHQVTRGARGSKGYDGADINVYNLDDKKMKVENYTLIDRNAFCNFFRLNIFRYHEANFITLNME